MRAILCFHCVYVMAIEIIPLGVFNGGCISVKVDLLFLLVRLQPDVHFEWLYNNNSQRVIINISPVMMPIIMKYLRQIQLRPFLQQDVFVQSR